MQDRMGKIIALGEKMDIPSVRREDLGWLMRNAFIRNSEHPDFEEFIENVRDEIRTRFKQ